MLCPQNKELKKLKDKATMVIDFCLIFSISNGPLISTEIVFYNIDFKTKSSKNFAVVIRKLLIWQNEGGGLFWAFDVGDVVKNAFRGLGPTAKFAQSLRDETGRSRTLDS